MSLPLSYFTADLPGTGGELRSDPADFEVEEIPAYAPTGEGSHVFAWIEKRGLTTFQAMRALAGAVGVHERDVGSAGMKDRHAVTRQVLSFPPPVTPEALLAARIDGVSVMSAVRHARAAPGRAAPPPRRRAALPPHAPRRPRSRPAPPR